MFLAGFARQKHPTPPIFEKIRQGLLTEGENGLGPETLSCAVITLSLTQPLVNE